MLQNTCHWWEVKQGKKKGGRISHSSLLLLDNRNQELCVWWSVSSDIKEGFQIGKTKLKTLTQDQWRNLILKIYSCSISLSYWCEPNETNLISFLQKQILSAQLLTSAFLQNDKQVILQHQNTSFKNSSTSWVKIFLSQNWNEESFPFINQIPTLALPHLQLTWIASWIPD